MTFERTQDLVLVREVLTHPRIYRAMTDDSCPPREQYEPLEHPAVWYVRVREADELLGLFVFVPQTGICFEVHTCLLPEAWGEKAREACRGVREWMWRNSPCRRIVTSVPAYNRLALKLSLDAGLEQYGVNPRAFQKGGKLWDVHLLGISKEV